MTSLSHSSLVTTLQSVISMAERAVISSKEATAAARLAGVQANSALAAAKLALLEVEGSNIWWSSGTDVGVDGAWKWATSYSPVGDFVWSEGSPPTKHRTQNCLVLSYALDFMGINTNCVTTGAFPICQIKPY